jgi:probable addiction module antidote protein
MAQFRGLQSVGEGVSEMRKMPKLKKANSKTEFAPFEASDFLSSDEVIEEYLKAALEDPNPELFLLAVASVAKARGIAKVAKGAGLGRESLYKALAPGAKPRYETVRKLVNSLGMRLTVTAT